MGALSQPRKANASMKQAVKLILVMTILLGGGYTVLMWGIGQIFFHDQVNGSLIYQNGKLIGSDLLSQKTEALNYFWPRPSAGDYATVASGASNQGATSAALKEAVEKRADVIRKAHNLGADVQIPADLLLASGSGLDPHISPEAANFQVDRVAKARNLSPEQTAELQKLVEKSVEGLQWGFFGAPRVNVLRLNLELDKAFPNKS